MSSEDQNLSRLELLAVVEELRRTVARQQQRIAELEKKLAGSRKNSSNSSKPPSSDIVKPERHCTNKAEPAKRKRGGQPGHLMHDRPPFDADQVSDTRVHELTACPDCGGSVTLTGNAPRVLQKVELIEPVPWTVTEHRAHAYACTRCACVHYAKLPTEVERGGMLGPKLLAWIGYMKGVMHASFSTLRKYLRDVLHLTLSRSRLAKAVDQVSQSLKQVHDQLGAQLPEASSLRVDETGHKDDGRRHWTWCFRAEGFTWFHIDPTRSSRVLWDVLGERFAGVIGCDYFSAYRKYMRESGVLVQFCLAHLIRDVKYLTTLPDAPTAAYGKRLVEKIRELFQRIHEGQTLPPATLTVQLHRASRAILRTATTRVPAGREARAISQRFEKHGAAYFQFITTPGIEPTNNLAEQALRFVVIDRQITQGTRGVKGQRWSERIWTIHATCAQQGRSAKDFLTQALTAWVHGHPPPSLLPIPAPT